MARHPQLAQAIALSEAGRNEEAVAAIRQLASTGEPEALYALATMTWRGGLVEQEPVRARTLYQHAAARGHGGSAVILTNLLASGVAGKRDWRPALDRLEAEARILPDRKRAFDLVKAMNLNADGDPRLEAFGDKLAERPGVTLFRNLLSKAECDYLRDAIGQNYEPSMVYDKDRRLVRDEIRTSDGATVHWLVEDPAVVAINRRIAAATASEYEQGEALALLRYQPGQQYRPHFDFVKGAENRRLMTALVYLNDDYDGGETAFVQTGLEVKGRTGDMLMFVNDGGDAGPDPLSEHEGRPVTKGIKYLATRWIREARWIP